MEAKIIQRYAKKTIPQLLKLAQKHFNTYIRERDKKDGFFICISCNQPKALDQMNAGHYMNMGHHSRTRFDEENCFGQCVRCNLYLSGNLVGYRVGIVNKIGLEKVAALEIRAKEQVKWDKYGLIDIIETYKQKLKDLKPSIVRQLRA